MSHWCINKCYTGVSIHVSQVYQCMLHWCINTCHTGVSIHVTLLYQNMLHWCINTCNTGVSMHVTLVYHCMSHWYICTCNTGASIHVTLVYPYIIIIIIIFKCYFSGELIALSYRKKQQQCEYRIRKNKQIKSTVHDGKN